MIIAIDGPAASGKSTVARAVATRLGFAYLDTGAMYRAVAAEALRRGIPTDDAEALTALAEALTLRFEHEGGSALPTRVLSDGRDLTSEIRTPAVDVAVSPVSAVPGVRAAMVRVQREMASRGDCVVEGRDIGTVVFPGAEVKVYLSASAQERARRRTGDMERAGHDLSERTVLEHLERRDEADSTREASPLTVASDAVELDTTGLRVEEVVERIAAMGEARRGRS
jgi:CMP/dCMP kinase